ncbi:transposase [Thiomicrorhabdus sp. Kp2]|uniref:transposase n=1 Tax=Thiomicrorhabdus sp. Kp2 TaxID=1123518 RepID=UPI00040DDE87|nr:transposase [Thiomicrorhabdus sp. Kp2]
MARLARVAPVGVPVHVYQRGNNHQVVFAEEADFVAYLGWLIEYSQRYGVDIHAWCLMTNHIHLLCTPKKQGAISQMMQAVGRHYVRYFNFTYKRSGTLWEGRYKSCLVQEDSYLLDLHRYIEMNPVTADMVQEPSEYAWSSYQMNALGKQSKLGTPHPLYLALGVDEKRRQSAYRDLFTGHVLGVKLIEEIEQATLKGMALGNDQFKAQIELLTGRRVSPKKPGRPTGWRKVK